MPKKLKVHEIILQYSVIKLQEITRDKCFGCCFHSEQGCIMPDRIAERLGSRCAEEDIIYKNITNL